MWSIWRTHWERERGFKRENVGMMTVMQISICESSVISEDGPSLAGSPMTSTVT